MKTEIDAKYMRRAIALAKKGSSGCHPNPLVGAVIVKDGRIIGEGYHAKYGDLHAERNAIRNLTESAEGAVMYVTLEVCCHTGKQPPCTEAVIGAGIRTVVIGSRDPNPLVAGGGVKRLREAGIAVVEDFLRDECDALNPVFFHYITKKMPYVRYKYAMTADGNTATGTRASKWISGPDSQDFVQDMRNENMAIMVGIGTVLADNPMLTCHKEGEGYRNPIRIVCDGRMSIPMDSAIVKTAGQVRTILAAGKSGSGADSGKRAQLEQAGLTVLSVPSKENPERVDLTELMRKLAETGIDSILLEGGGTLAAGMLAEGLICEADVFVAPKFFGGHGISPMEGRCVAVPGDAWKMELQEVRTFGEDVFLRYRVKEGSNVYGNH